MDSTLSVWNLKKLGQKRGRKGGERPYKFMGHRVIKILSFLVCLGPRRSIQNSEHKKAKEMIKKVQKYQIIASFSFSMHLI